MNIPDILQILDNGNIVPGKSCLKITFIGGEGSTQDFDGDMATDLIYFSMMNGRDFVIKPQEAMILSAVIESRSWDNNQNRTFEIAILDGFDSRTFATKLRDIIEKIEVT